MGRKKTETTLTKHSAATKRPTLAHRGRRCAPQVMLEAVHPQALDGGSLVNNHLPLAFQLGQQLGVPHHSLEGTLLRRITERGARNRCKRSPVHELGSSASSGENQYSVGPKPTSALSHHTLHNRALPAAGRPHQGNICSGKYAGDVYSMLRVQRDGTHRHRQVRIPALW